MTPFATDPAPDSTSVKVIPSPLGALSLSKLLTKATVPLTWGTWSNGYTGNVYFAASEESVTITLPANIAAVYFYIEPDSNGASFTVTAEDSLVADTTSSPVTAPNSNGGAMYFGFYDTGGQTLSKITVSGTIPADGFAIGEFGIASVPPPTVLTGSATNVTAAGAQLGGTVNPQDSPTTSFFEYGTTTSYGQATPSPAAHDGNGSEAVTASAAVTGLQPGTVYHYRLVATNSVGATVQGADETFTTSTVPPPPVVKHCLVPKLSHLSLKAAKSALAKANCVLGSVKQQKRPKSVKGLSFGVLAESPKGGTTTAAGSKITLTMGWFKRHKAHK